MKKISLTFIRVALILIVFRPLIADQIRLKGDGYMGYNMSADAIRQYRKAALLDPGSSLIRTRLGYAYKSISDIDSAMKSYKRAVVLDPQNIIACYELGVICAFNKDFRRAKGYFLKAGAIPYLHNKMTKDDYGFYHYASLDMLALSQEKSGHIDEAIGACEEILEYIGMNDPASIRIEERLKRLKEMRQRP